MNSANENETVIIRVLNAPREKVWKAWTDQKQVEKWWGPKDFTNPVCRLQLRPGGVMRIDMRAPDGTIYPMGGTYHDISKPERLVFATAALDKRHKAIFELLNTVTFEKNGRRTKLTLHSRLMMAKPEARKYLKGGDEGWRMSFDKLAKLIEK